MTDTVAPEPTPEQAALMARVRRMMLIAGLTSALAVAVVLIAVGYRLYRGEGSSATASSDVTAALPKGARIVSTGIAGDDMISGVANGGALCGDGTGEDQRLQARPRQFRAKHRQHAVEPGRALVAADGDSQPLAAIRSATRRSAVFQRRAFA